jgi:hypothetical protein
MPTGAITGVTSISTPDFIEFDTTPTTSSANPGTLFWDAGDAGLDLILNANVTARIGQNEFILATNQSGSTIAKGSVVYINGAQGQKPTLALASASSEATSSKTFGFAAEAITNGSDGYVVTFGIIRGLNTLGLTEGAALWLSTTAGQYTTTMPAAPDHAVFVGYVVKANASSGEVLVKIQNGYELQELHNVLITSVTNGQTLVYDSATSLWKNATPVGDPVVQYLDGGSSAKNPDVIYNSGTSSTTNWTYTIDPGGAVVTY